MVRYRGHGSDERITPTPVSAEVDLHFRVDPGIGARVETSLPRLEDVEEEDEFFGATAEEAF